MAKILGIEGADKRAAVKFYGVVVQAAILLG